MFIFFLLYLASRKISLREKAVYCTLLVLFFASFSTNMLNFIWHGFHYPNSLPCRQSFIYIALMLLICYRAYMYLDVTPWKHVAIAFWGSASFVILAEKLVQNKQFHFSVFYVALLFLALYAGLIYLYKRRRKGADLAVLLALAVVSIEAAVNTTVTSVPTTSRTAYTRDNKDVITLMSEVNPQTFYRVEKVDRKTKNDGAWMNFPSVSLFSSTANASLSDFFRKLGCESSTNAYSITGSTPLVDSLFSVKYGIYDQEQVTGELLSFAGRRGDTWLYENLYTLPVAFMLPNDVEGNWILDTANPAYVQNDLCNVLDTPSVLVPVETIPNGSRLTFTPDVTGDYYVCLLYTSFTIYLVPGLTIFLASMGNWFDTNLSVLGNTDGRRGLLMLWGWLTGIYYYRYMLYLFQLGRYRGAAGRWLLAAAGIFIMTAVVIPYLPEQEPGEAALHVALAFFSPILLAAALVAFLRDLSVKNRQLFREVWGAMWGIAALSLVLLFEMCIRDSHLRPAPGKGLFKQSGEPDPAGDHRRPAGELRLRQGAGNGRGCRGHRLRGSDGRGLPAVPDLRHRHVPGGGGDSGSPAAQAVPAGGGG